MGNAIHICNATGDGSTIETECAGTDVCRSGACINACDDAAGNLSNIGCEYWAVDLDNEYAGAINDAAAEQYAVAIANVSPVEVTVIVEQNDAPIGAAAPSESLTTSVTIGAYDLARIDLPRRDVDCADAMEPSGIGTCHTGNAYKITTNFPVVAYQFNPIIQSFSNDASLMIPKTGIDTHYRILGWPTANPIDAGFPIEGIPDRSYVTIVGTEANTTVNVTLGGPINGNPAHGIGALNAGEVVTARLMEYEVLNLSSRDIPGDMTGTIVEADKPVAVFSGGERAIAPRNTDGITPPPSGFTESWCCTEHLEEQVVPTVAWGTNFVMTRSPTRSDVSGWREPDIYRVMADKPGTTITTNLPAPNDSFTLGENEWREFAAHDGFIMQASEAVQIEQILVSQGFLPSWRAGHGGDPSMILFPPYEQYRSDYIFYAPDTFSANYIVLAMPVGTRVEIDGLDVNGDEFMAICAYEEVGNIEGILYMAATCPVTGGVHRAVSDLPVGLMVYGYYGVGSYGYAAGSNLERINFI
jgi:hypothetical protein